MVEETQKEFELPNEKQQDNLFQLTRDASIKAALGAFDSYLEVEEKSIHTRKAFASDIRLLGKYLGVGQPIGEIGTKNLNDFLGWLQHGRGVPCSRKSYARRVTTLKVFFKWLQESGVLQSNPADAVVQVSVSSPLPEIPTREELNRALKVTSEMQEGTDDRKPDARPHLLLTLLINTGIKKSEAVALVPNHIDRSDPDAPFVFIRYPEPQKRVYKERKIPLEPAWLETLDEYLDQYHPQNSLFDCTARNLEYILSDVGEAAGLPQGKLSFENLRWASALYDLEQGVESNRIRQKLGLAPVTWRDTKSKLEKLRERTQKVG